MKIAFWSVKSSLTTLTGWSIAYFIDDELYMDFIQVKRNIFIWLHTEDGHVEPAKQELS